MCCSQLPYAQEAFSNDTLDIMSHDSAVSALRNGVGADLVHLIWFGEDVCGLA